jgi:hypothetical protein
VVRADEEATYAGEIARHSDHAGEADMAYRWALTAAHAAVARFAYAEALSWLDLAGTNARTAADAERVGRMTAEVLGRAGWSEPPPAAALPLTRQIVSEDLDLRVQG